VQRGIWEFGPVQLSSGDIFGFSVKRALLEEKQSIVVYPKIVPIHVLGLPTLHPFGDFNTPRRVMEDPLRPVGAREYAPGDSFRHIDWKATARRHTLQTKLFEPSASRPLAVFLNTRTTRSSGKRIQIQPKNDPYQLNQILEALARMEDDWPWTLSALLEAEANRLRYGTSIVVITSLLDDRLLKILIDLRQKEYGVTLVTLGGSVLNKSVSGVRHYHIGGHEVWHELETLELA
jgi:uncharacterized protein (DUF58 family)